MALQSPPQSWQMDLGNGLVFHANLEGASGVFDGDGQLVYGLGGFPFGQLFFADDGMSFLYLSQGVRPELFNAPYLLPLNESDALVLFFSQGELSYSFYIQDLVDNPAPIYAEFEARGGWEANRIPEPTLAEQIALGPTVVWWNVNTPATLWDIHHHRRHNQAENTLQVVTATENTALTFDLTSGQIIAREEFQASGAFSISWFIGLLLIVAIIATVIRGFMLKRKQDLE